MRDPLDVIAEICHDQPEGALEKIAQVLGLPPTLCAASVVRPYQKSGPQKLKFSAPEGSPLWNIPRNKPVRLYIALDVDGAPPEGVA